MQPTPPETASPVSTDTEPATMSPLTRWTRTFLQVIGALIIAVPTAAALVGIPASTSAAVVGVMSATVVIVSAVHNALNSSSAARRGRTP